MEQPVGLYVSLLAEYMRVVFQPERGVKLAYLAVKHLSWKSGKGHKMPVIRLRVGVSGIWKWWLESAVAISTSFHV